MRLSNLNKFSILILSFFFFFLSFIDLKAEQQIDLWKKDNKNIQTNNEDKKDINKIANDSYEPKYGARPLSRELRRQIENPLAAKLLEDNFKNKKNITIKLNPAKKDEIVFKPS